MPDTSMKIIDIGINCYHAILFEEINHSQTVQTTNLNKMVPDFATAIFHIVFDQEVYVVALYRRHSFAVLTQ